MAAQPPSYASEAPFPQVQELSYQPVPAQESKLEPTSSGYAPAPPQYDSAQTGPYYHQPNATSTSTQSSNVTVVTQQPGLPQVMEVRSKPNNFLILSIVNMLCCFFILGLIALIFSVQVDSAWSSGDYQSAQHNSNVAKILNYIGVGVGTACWVAVGVLTILQVVATVGSRAASS